MTQNGTVSMPTGFYFTILKHLFKINNFYKHKSIFLLFNPCQSVTHKIARIILKSFDKAKYTILNFATLHIMIIMSHVCIENRDRQSNQVGLPQSWTSEMYYLVVRNSITRIMDREAGVNAKQGSWLMQSWTNGLSSLLQVRVCSAFSQFCLNVT